MSTLETRLTRLSSAGTETVRGVARIREYASFDKSSFQTASSLMSFFLAALLSPDVQTIAQEELDAVTRRERLPTLEDRSRLPYVDAVCKEVMRWRPVAPIGEWLPSTCLDCNKSMMIHRCTPCHHRR